MARKILLITPMWDKIKTKYGILGKDYSRSEENLLVWNHPRITCKGMQGFIEVFIQAIKKKQITRITSKQFKAPLDMFEAYHTRKGTTQTSKCLVKF